MAQRRKNLSVKKQELQRQILTHAFVLNLRTIVDYQDWCREHGYSSSLNKTANQKIAEVQTFKKVESEKQLKKHNKEKNQTHQIQAIYEGKLKLKDIDNDVLANIFTGFKKSKDRKHLLKCLYLLERKTKLLTTAETTRGCIALTRHKHLWLRDINDWAPTSHNVFRQFSALSRYLLSHYQIPTFLDQVWYTGKTIEQCWFIHLGKGKNIRTARKLPIEVTKKMAHLFLQAPADSNINSAFRYAQIKSAGGSNELVRAINGTRLARTFKDDEFWQSVIRFFINNPMLDYTHVNPIVDYIWNERYVPRVEFIARGEAREIGPAQPNFSMRGRSVATLLRNVALWHRQLGIEAKSKNLQWQRSTFDDYKFIEGEEGRKNMKIWTIRELVSSRELHAEGRQQKHCVASYAHSCSKGISSIWTMDVQNYESHQKKVTIEIDLKYKTICQIRGKENRLATDIEMSVINRWAMKENLKVRNC